VDCIFCAIRDGKIPSFKVYEDERTMAFMDINPLNDGHLLVISKSHAPSLFEIADEDCTAVMLAAKRLATAVDRALQPPGLNVLQANGPAAVQSVPHYHLHVIPRWFDDGRGMDWPLERGDMERIKAVAEKVKAAL